MKIKLSPLYLIAFFALVFLVHEIHDWIHVLVARAVTGCWGTKAFDLWTVCSRATVYTKGNVLIMISAPLFNFLVMCWGWELMQPENDPGQQSLGFSLVFASLPLPRIMAALVGGGDETTALKALFMHADGSNRHMVSLIGLSIILLLSLPALYRAFMLVAGWGGKLLVVVFLVVPGYVDHYIVSVLMNKTLSVPVLSHEVWTGFPRAVMGWLLLLVLITIFLGHFVLNLFEYKEIDV